MRILFFAFFSLIFYFNLQAKYKPQHKAKEKSQHHLSIAPTNVDSIKKVQTTQIFDAAVADRVQNAMYAKIVIGSILGLIILLIIISKINSARKRRNELDDKFEIRDQINAAFSKHEILEQHHTEIINNFESLTLQKLKKAFEVSKSKKMELDHLSGKYGNVIALRIINHQYWIGMSEQQLRESKGAPDKIEVEVMKTKTKRIYIYGNKSSGDVFNFVDGALERFKDR